MYILTLNREQESENEYSVRKYNLKNLLHNCAVVRGVDRKQPACRYQYVILESVLHYLPTGSQIAAGIQFEVHISTLEVCGHDSHHKFSPMKREQLELPNLFKNSLDYVCESWFGNLEF